MKKWTRAMVAALVAGSLTLGSLPVLAQTSGPKIDKREYRQQNRIYQGVDTGQLAPREFRYLEGEQARIRAAEARMKADGRFTRRERARLHQRLNRSNRHIYRAKHNRRGR